MVPKSGSRVPKRLPYSDAEIAAIISRALVAELGGSRRATKTVMKWAHVSDRSARAWINGESCPSSCHLVLLASRSRAVMTALLGMAGHDHLAVALDLSEIEQELEHLVERVRELRNASKIV